MLIGVILGGLILYFGVIRPDSDQTDQQPLRKLEPDDDQVSSFASPEDTGFVGSEACRRCHAALVESYFEHPMARSMMRVADDNWAEFDDCPSGEVPGQRRLLTAECNLPNMTHHERMYDDKAELIYDQQFPMDFVIGSGVRAKAYLHRRGDLLFMSPLNWYRSTETWDLSPNYELDDVRRFDRRASEDCLGCHAGRINVKARGTHTYSDPTFLETRIGCERCHGPGEAHIAFHDGASSDSEFDAIINPADLDQTRSESVCYQCHLASAARVLRPGRSHLDFRPGMKLSEIWAVLDRGIEVSDDGRTRSVNHVQQMRSSVCFQKSSEQMGCVSCHDPHGVISPEAQLTFYRDRCLNCHTQIDCASPNENRLLQKDSCIACHMPTLDSSNMDHVAQTDHRILRKPQSEILHDDPPDDRKLEFFAEMEHALSPAERNRALVLGTFIDQTRKEGRPSNELTQELKNTLIDFPDDGSVLTALGILTRQQNDLVAARNYFERAVTSPSQREPALFELLQISYRSREWSLAKKYAKELLEIDAFDPRTHAMLGDTLWNLGQLDQAIEAVRRASDLNPGSLPLREWLADRYRRTRRIRELQQEERTIERLRRATIPTEIRERSPE